MPEASDADELHLDERAVALSILVVDVHLAASTAAVVHAQHHEHDARHGGRHREHAQQQA